MAMLRLQNCWTDPYRAVVLIESRPARRTSHSPTSSDTLRFEFALCAGSPYARPAGKPSVQTMGFTNMLNTHARIDGATGNGVDKIAYRYVADRLTEERSGTVSGICRWSTYLLSETRCIALLDLSSCQTRPSRRRATPSPVGRSVDKNPDYPYS
jgi:hypothetical protein